MRNIRNANPPLKRLKICTSRIAGNLASDATAIFPWYARQLLTIKPMKNTRLH
jgi:hypothetical protein